jgi:hypothetical protein
MNRNSIVSFKSFIINSYKAGMIDIFLIYYLLNLRSRMKENSFKLI